MKQRSRLKAVRDAGGLIVIQLSKSTLALTPDELHTLLSRSPDLWEKALRRGKALRRAEALARRAQEGVVT